ncbi:MAG: cobalt ECF transporter T component CbiQ [Armatimonadetes bacterium]|nr:cobalt ECF transporter T component CbiQ [Armatimonadota bacterium]
MTLLPEWMRPQSTPDDWNSLPSALENVAKHSRRRGTVRRAMGAFAGLLSGILADDAIASRPGFLQDIDARFKVVGLIGLLVVATFLHGFPALGVCCAVVLVLASASRVPMKRLAGTWLVVPLFSAAIMLPATLNIVTHGSPVWTIWRFSSSHFGPWTLPDTLCVTDAGLVVAGRFILRTIICVSFAMLLACTTTRPRLFNGLRALGVPRIFVMLLGIMERYLGVLVRSAEEIHLAKISRSVAQGDLRQEQAWVAAGIGSLFRRSYRLSQIVYMAMLSRGYTGEVHLLDPPRSQTRDWIFLAGCVALSAMLLVIR